MVAELVLGSNYPFHMMAATAWDVLAHDLEWLAGASWLGCKIPSTAMLTVSELIWGGVLIQLFNTKDDKLVGSSQVNF